MYVYVYIYIYVCIHMIIHLLTWFEGSDPFMAIDFHP